MRTVKQKSWPAFLPIWGSEAPACGRQACGSRDTNHGLFPVCHGCARVAPPESAARTAVPPNHCFPVCYGAAMERHERQIAPEPVSAAHLPPFTVASRRAPFAAPPVPFRSSSRNTQKAWSCGRRKRVLRSSRGLTATVRASRGACGGNGRCRRRGWCVRR